VTWLMLTTSLLKDGFLNAEFIELSLWDNCRLHCLIFGKIVASQSFLGDFSNNYCTLDG
jgi:hypothetical protein